MIAVVDLATHETTQLVQNMGSKMVPEMGPPFLTFIRNVCLANSRVRFLGSSFGTLFGSAIVIFPSLAGPMLFRKVV